MPAGSEHDTLPSALLEGLSQAIGTLASEQHFGRVTAVSGMLVEIGGVRSSLSIGGRCTILSSEGESLPCEVVGFRDGRTLAMPFGPLTGIGLGCRVEVSTVPPAIYPTPAWLGRVVNAFGQPIDGKGPLPQGQIPYPLRNQPPPAHARRRVEGKLDLGVRALNTFLTCCRGQRMGIFAGSRRRQIRAAVDAGALHGQ